MVDAEKHVSEAEEDPICRIQKVSFQNWCSTGPTLSSYIPKCRCSLYSIIGARPHFRPNPYYEDLERMEEEIIPILHNLEMENTEIHENNHKLQKEITFSR